MSQPKYRFSPSLLNNMQRLLDSDKEFEDASNTDPEGNYKRTYEEIAEAHEQELLDYINKADNGPIEAADKGTVFNEIIDRLILHQKDGREDVEIRSSKTFSSRTFLGETDEVGKPVYGDVMNEELPIPCIYGWMHGFEFAYDLQMCLDLARELHDSVPQYHTEAIINTKYGDVILHGFVDYILHDKVIDLKTTSRYQFPKFDTGWQKDVYPYCLIESGDMQSVSEFNYLVIQWRSLTNQPLGGTRYNEPYTYDHEKAKARLRAMCEVTIEWLELNRDKITDKRVFGE